MMDLAPALLHATPQVTESFEQCATSGKTGCMMIHPESTLLVFGSVLAVILVLAHWRRQYGGEDE